MKFSGDIIITDPMYVVISDEDWHNCEYGEELDVLGFTAFWTHDGADGLENSLLNTDTGEMIGEFGSDSCMISVMLLDEVLAYNPTLLEELGDWCYIIIRNFDGEIDAVDLEDDEDQFWKLVGTGNINFESGCADE